MQRPGATRDHDPAIREPYREKEPNVSQPKLVDPRDTTGLDVSGLLSPQHRAHLADLGPRYALFAGWRMEGGCDDEDCEIEDCDGDHSDEDTDPETEIVIGGKVLKVGKIQRMLAAEKRQGKRSGASELLKDLGFDSVDDAKAFVEKFKEKPKKKSKDDDVDDEAAQRARERETAAEKREREAKARERKADLRGALRDAGVSRDDLDDAWALLDRAVDAEYDQDELEEAVEALQERRPALFDGSASDGGEKAKPRPKARIPQGRPKSRNQPGGRKFGQGGLERAKRDGFIKD